MKITYPDEFNCKIIANETACSIPTKAEIVVPTIVKPGEPFTAKIALTDDYGMPAADFSGEIVLRQPECDISVTVEFPSVISALAEIQELLIPAAGIYRFETEFNGKVFFSNPCICSSENRPQIFWGDPHIHTVLSNCHADKCRSLNFCFNAARYLSCLDWAGVADHVSNGRCELARWKEQTAAANAYNEPPAFVTLPAYEVSLKGGCGGDNNVYTNKFPSTFIDECDCGNVKTLCQKLTVMAEKEKFSFFVVPHHTTRTEKHGEIPDEIYPGEKLMSVMEIHSKWGSSEYRGNPHALKEIHSGMSYAVDFLNRGLKIGFVGGTDSHATLTFARGAHEPSHIDRLPGLTAVLAENLERDSIFQAIRQKNCYAASGERIYLDFKINSIGMGQSKKADKDDVGKRHIFFETAGKSDIKSVEIIRNGIVIAKSAPNDWHIVRDIEDKETLNNLWRNSGYGKFVYYYARVICHSGAFAWSSPIWFTE